MQLKKVSQCLGKYLRSFLLLLTQTLIKEHAGVTQKWPALIGKNQPPVAHFNQAIAYQ